MENTSIMRKSDEKNIEIFNGIVKPKGLKWCSSYGEEKYDFEYKNDGTSFMIYKNNEFGDEVGDYYKIQNL